MGSPSGLVPGGKEGVQYYYQTLTKLLHVFPASNYHQLHEQIPSVRVPFYQPATLTTIVRWEPLTPVKIQVVVTGGNG